MLLQFIDFDLQRKRMGKPTLAEEQQALPIALKQKIEKGEKLTQKELNDLNKEGKVPDFDAEDENGFDWAAQPIAAHTLDIGAGRQISSATMLSGSLDEHSSAVCQAVSA